MLGDSKMDGFEYSSVLVYLKHFLLTIEYISSCVEIKCVTFASFWWQRMEALSQLLLIYHTGFLNNLQGKSKVSVFVSNICGSDINGILYVVD